MTRISFIKGLIAAGSIASLPAAWLKEYDKLYLLQCFVAGFQFHKGVELLPQMKEGDLLAMQRQPDNAHDSMAIALRLSATGTKRV